MAWYRTGGGGLPSSLVTDMNAVLNKKMGTSTVYPSSEWADTVNLMGKLPEKTVGGAIARFDDGADGVPLKNLVANIPANEEGVSSVETTQMGKNLAILVQDILDHDSTSNGVTYHATSESTLHISGTATSTSWMTTTYSYNSPQLKFLRKGTYTLSSNVVTGTSTSGARVAGYYKGQTTLTQFSSYARSVTKRVFTLDDDAYIWITMTIPSGDTIDQDVWIQIEAGSTATNYEAYVTPVIKTAQLGRTIYGGTADVVTGEGEDEGGNPFTFTPVSINSLLGTNTIWNNLGNTTVTYRRDIELALSAGAPLMMMASRPPIQEQPQEEEESTDESI